MSRPAKKQALQKLAGDPDPDVPPEDDAEDEGSTTSDWVDWADELEPVVIEDDMLGVD